MGWVPAVKVNVGLVGRTLPWLFRVSAGIPVIAAPLSLKVTVPVGTPLPELPLTSARR